MTGKQTADLDEGIPLSLAWRAIWRFRLMIVSILACSLLVGLAVLAVLPARYDAMARIRIGQVSGLGSFEEPGTLTARIIAQYGADSAGRRSSRGAYVRTALLRRGTTDVIEVVATGQTSDEARRLLEKVYQDISTTHKRAYDSGIGVLKASLDDLERRRAELASAQHKLTALIAGKVEGIARDDVGFLIMQQAQIAQTLTDLDARVPAIVANMSPPRSSPTALLGQITSSDLPSSPNRVVILGVSLILGAITALLAAIIRFRITITP